MVTVNYSVGVISKPIDTGSADVSPSGSIDKVSIGDSRNLGRLGVALCRGKGDSI